MEGDRDEWKYLIAGYDVPSVAFSIYMHFCLKIIGMHEELWFQFYEVYFGVQWLQIIVFP